MYIVELKILLKVRQVLVSIKKIFCEGGGVDTNSKCLIQGRNKINSALWEKPVGWAVSGFIFSLDQPADQPASQPASQRANGL